MKPLNLNAIRRTTICVAIAAVIVIPGTGHAFGRPSFKPPKPPSFAPIVSKVEPIKQKAGGVFGKISPPNPIDAIKEKVDTVYKQLENSSPLIDVIRNGKIINDLKDIVLFLNEQRADYQEFAESGIDAFSGDIANLLDGFGDIGGLMKLGKDLDDKLDKAHDLIARLPPQFMYILHKAIGPKIAELSEEVQSLAEQLEVVARLPSNREMLSDPELYVNSLCPLVEERAVKVTYEIILARLKLFQIKLESINDKVPDNLTVVVNVVGGGGTTVPFPAKPVSQRLTYTGKRIIQRLENAKNIATAVCEV